MLENIFKLGKLEGRGPHSQRVATIMSPKIHVKIARGLENDF